MPESRKALKCILAFFLIYLSWLLPPFQSVWEMIDRAFYLFVNGWIAKNPFWQNFWAVMNHSLMDWIFDVVMFIFLSIYVIKPNGKTKTYKILKIFILICFVAIVTITINRLFLSEFLHIRRKSPSLIVEGGMRLSSFVNWLKVKETHHACFPGDHGTTTIFFAFAIFYLMGKRFGFVALGFSILFTLPRLVVGAHWLTDVLIGSFSIAAISLSLFFYTNLFSTICNRAYNTLFSRKQA